MIKETMTPTERMWSAIRLEPYDRVPVAPLLDVMFPARHKGITLAEAFSDYRGKGWQSMVDLFDEVGGWDGFFPPGFSLTPNPKRPFNAPSGIMKYPGKGLPVNASPQCIESESMTVQDYDDIIKMGWFGWLQKIHDKVSRFSIEQSALWAERQITQYRREVETWQKRCIPVIIGAFVSSPLMALSASRSMTAFAMDIHRIPDKVNAAMDAMVDDLIQNTIEVTKLTGVPGVQFGHAGGGGFYYPLRIFERFEMPYIKKMTDAFAKEGIITMLHLDQDWTLNLPYFLDLPKKMCICELDSKTNIFKAKEILKNHMCIAGDVPAGLQALGTKQEMESYCMNLIDIVGKETEFILSSGCSVSMDCKFENFKTMVDTAKNYFHSR